jgi:uncharacterized protein YndB with AHSA1/START domain
MSDRNYADRAVYKVLIKAPIETVWSELMNLEKPRPFFWNSKWDTPGLTPGQPYRMLSADGKAVGVVGRFLEMDPPHRLVTSFRLTSLKDPPSRVIYELKETPHGVEFSLITENVVAGSKSEKSMANGSRFIVGNFKSFIEKGKITPGAQVMLAMMGVMSPMMPKVLRAENWPLAKVEA